MQRIYFIKNNAQIQIKFYFQSIPQFINYWWHGSKYKTEVCTAKFFIIDKIAIKNICITNPIG